MQRLSSLTDANKKYHQLKHSFCKIFQVSYKSINYHSKNCLSKPKQTISLFKISSD